MLIQYGNKMKKFTFSKKYFKTLVYDDPHTSIRVVVNETPSMDIEHEDYSLRIETRHQEIKPVHRKYAIEHHKRQEKHQYPHLQFTFHTEEIGTFWIRLDFKDMNEYENAILGFIYKIKNVLEELEHYKEGISEDILILELVNELSNEGNFLTNKIAESIEKYQIEFQDYLPKKEIMSNINSNELLIEFLGKDNIKKVQKTYEERKLHHKKRS